MAKYRLCDIAPVIQGDVPRADQYWLLNLDMVESNTGRIIEYLYCAEKDIGNSTVKFDTRNVLYSKLRPYLNKVVLPQKPGYATSEMLPLCPDQSVITREYLTYYLRSPSFVSFINEKTSGAKMPRANSADLKSYLLECPSIYEQQIATQQLDSLVSIINKRALEIQKLDDLIKARFVELFGDPITNPKGWGKRKFGDVVYYQEGPGVRNWQFRDSGIKLINIRNVVDDKLDLSNTNNYLEADEVNQKYAHFLLNEGDYVMASSGVTWGKIAEVYPEHLPLCLNTSMIRLRPIDSSVICKKYIYHFIKSDGFRKQIEHLITGSAQPNFGPSHLSKVDILVPDIVLQNKFSKFVEQVDKSKSIVRKSLDEAQLLFDSLMQKYFG